MNKKFLSLIISVDISKYKTIFSKNNLVNFATSILIIIDKYLIIFVHLSTITKIMSYMTFSRLLDDKSIIKFINISFHDTLGTDKEFNSL